MPDSVASLGSSVGALGLSNIMQPGTTRQDDPDKIHHAAQQFESLLISQILKTAHDDSEGWLGTGDDQAGSSAMEIGQEQFAQALSAQGGLGLASLIEKGLTTSRNANDQ
jgi:Rod binding domain-containing protein